MENYVLLSKKQYSDKIVEKIIVNMDYDGLRKEKVCQIF